LSYRIAVEVVIKDLTALWIVAVACKQCSRPNHHR